MQMRIAAIHNFCTEVEFTKKIEEFLDSKIDWNYRIFISEISSAST